MYEDGNNLSTTKEYTYDSYGNITGYILERDGLQDLQLEQTYTNDTEEWILGQSTLMKVYDEGRTLLREQRRVYDSDGQVSEIELINDLGNNPRTQYSYNTHGQLTQVINPTGYTVALP